jgi:hypothetical protein
MHDKQIDRTQSPYSLITIITKTVITIVAGFLSLQFEVNAPIPISNQNITVGSFVFGKMTS